MNTPRIDKIVTKTGDQGTTSLADGQRLAKHHIRIQALGEVDELNAFFGVVAAQTIDDDIRSKIRSIQNQLFNLGAELCIPGYTQIMQDDIASLESDIETVTNNLPALKEFILPGGCISAANMHICRTVCRRVERCLWQLNQDEPLNDLSLIYINRLSDWCFACARLLNAKSGHSDIFWQKK